jgi:cytochrome c-type biogenesis protein CcmH/NrfF
LLVIDPKLRVKTKWFQGLVVAVLAVVMLGAGGTDSANRYGRIGHNLMCVCSCGQVLLECNHVGCPDSKRMIGELQDQLEGPNAAGADSLILNWFVAKYGATVLAAPIRGGFDVVAWIIPLTLFVLGIFGTALVVRTWSNRRIAAAGPGGLHVEVPMDDDVRARIRRDTEW